MGGRRARSLYCYWHDHELGTSWHTEERPARVESIMVYVRGYSCRCVALKRSITPYC